ncbi:hypothetical protein J3459_002533 [Metarhizium acridum]|uniref:Uncharacterized protein n=1 Tax=Metarhizium acridum (strain CQMa 102) TaxID=655827 RepID=E9EBE6_METAQ|nr:uncharacterized protein MAC_07194 [Metarhizium acridum CQMa 102]EFY86790.1 hypothetical protein MAC_07194 [Metarhizium acridum CQMa 102]KAG8428669.1 hypothetical protein J3459_002533 [Metarhizium acridum]
MLGFHATVRLHSQAKSWAEAILKLQIPEDALEDLEDKKAAALLAAQTRLKDKSLQAWHLQALVELTSEISRSQWQLINEYQHRVRTQCMNIPLERNTQAPETIETQQTSSKGEPKKATTRKRKSSHISGKSNTEELACTQSRPPTKNRAKASSIPSGIRALSKEADPPRDKYDMPTPRPGIPYLVLCGESKLIPAVVLYPGSAEGPFSVENTDLLCLEECCIYDQQKNILSCRDTAETSYPVKFFNAKDPYDGQTEWIAAAKLTPLDPAASLPPPYDRRVLDYIQKHGSSVSNPRRKSHAARRTLTHRNEIKGENQSHGPEHEIFDIEGTSKIVASHGEDDDRMAIARLI